MKTVPKPHPPTKKKEKKKNQESYRPRLWHKCFPVNFMKFLRTPFFMEHPWWLLLFMSVVILKTLPELCNCDYRMLFQGIHFVIYLPFSLENFFQYFCEIRIAEVKLQLDLKILAVSLTVRFGSKVESEIKLKP